jgi:signal transduction histidine kinase/CheY-like chemotaxis protein
MAAYNKIRQAGTPENPAPAKREIARDLKILRILTEHMTDGVMIVKPDGSIPYMNKRARELLTGAGALYCDENGAELPEEALPWRRASRGEILDNDLIKVSGPGGTLLLSIGSSPVTAGGQLKCAVLSLRAVTAQTSLICQLRETKNELLKEVDALNDLHRLNSNFIVNDDLDAFYGELLRTTLSITGAGKGSLQAFDEESQTLTMISGCGLSSEFLEYFNRLELDAGSCGKACLEKQLIYAPDVRQYVKDKTALEHLAREGIAAEQSMPLISSTGRLVGVLNTYYNGPRQPEAREQRILDLLARLTADTIERAGTTEALEQSRNQALTLVGELRKTDHKKNIFMSILSHELRNPLASISAGLQLLDIATEESMIANTRGIIKREMVQLCRLVDDILDLTHINTNKVVLEKEIVELKGLAASVAESYRLQFEEKGICLDFDFCEEALYVEADPMRIAQVLNNLLHNALKFTEDETGHVKLLTYLEGKDAVLCVRDNGIGISPEFLSELFEVFTQADTSLDRRKSGLGLGLAIVKGITALHGGSVGVTSEGLGKGASFFIRLPVYRAEPVAQKTEEAGEPESKRILLIEDNRNLAEILRTTLQLFGHRVTVEFSGADGIRTARSLLPDVIICDIGLPVVDGYEIARLIRSERSLQDIFMIALTGYSGTDDVMRAREAGFNYHLPKPLDMAALKAILSELP